MHIVFCQQDQPAYHKFYQDVEEAFQFIQGFDFEQLLSIATTDHERHLNILDSFYEELLRLHDYAKTANASWHKIVQVKYIKHNVFNKSSIGRDLELQLTHYIFFRFSRGIDQVDHFRQQLDRQKAVLLCYKDNHFSTFCFFKDWFVYKDYGCA